MFEIDKNYRHASYINMPYLRFHGRLNLKAFASVLTLRYSFSGLFQKNMIIWSTFLFIYGTESIHTVIYCVSLKQVHTLYDIL